MRCLASSFAPYSRKDIAVPQHFWPGKWKTVPVDINLTTIDHAGRPRQHINNTTNHFSIAQNNRLVQRAGIDPNLVQVMFRVLRNKLSFFRSNSFTIWKDPLAEISNQRSAPEGIIRT